ncbi:Caleosin related protein-domain-containing protein [Mycena haematopus]|nr:Caleosin related protein-domain-containing protein [Mycena haematopus]
MEPKAEPHIRGARRKGLQSHVAFFDTDQDGIIWPTDTYKGLREIGFGVFFASVAMVFIHLALSWFTSNTILPDMFFRIYVSRIDKALHGSDTGTFTQTGELDQRRFDYVFTLYSSPPHTHLTFQEGVRMLHGNRKMYDLFGWVAAAFDWGATYLLLKPADGRIAKHDVRDVLDGSLFDKLAQKNKKPEAVFGPETADKKLETVSKSFEAAPKKPETPPKVSETADKKPETVTKIPETAPKKPENTHSEKNGKHGKRKH